MPCLILQPIVENAVIHGAMKRKHGVVKITAKEMGDEVMISVSDNGYGIEQEVIDAIMENQINSSHVGLSNVHRRLLLTYGKDYGLKIQTSSEGTVISIFIPKS